MNSQDNNGDHYEENYTPTPCGNCYGTGKVALRIDNDPPVDIDCRQCNGTGVKSE